MLIKDEYKKWRFNFPLLIVVMLLCALSLLNLYSASVGAGMSERAYFSSHLQKVILGLVLMLILTFFHYRTLKSLVLPLYFVSLLLLVAVFFWGVERGGQKNWLNLGITVIQPGEFAKLSLILILAYYLDRYPLSPNHGLREVSKPLLIIALPMFFLMLEGDLGNTAFFLVIGVGMLWVAGLRKKFLVIALLLGLLFSPLAYKLGLSSNQKERIHSFLNPEADPQGKGYHLLQSKIAVGSGKIWGKGYQNGYFSRLKYLPERYTDFIFPVFAEEWGLIGSMVVVALLGLFIMLLIRSLSQLRDPFGGLIIVGISLWLFAQIALNLGGVLGIVPLAGVTLPFFSYGGSSLVTIFMALGLVFNIQMRRYVF